MSHDAQCIRSVEWARQSRDIAGIGVTGNSRPQLGQAGVMPPAAGGRCDAAYASHREAGLLFVFGVVGQSAQIDCQLGEGFRLDLPHALASQAELLADLLQRSRFVIVQAEPHP